MPGKVLPLRGPVGKAVNGPSIDAIIQKADQVVDEVAAVLDATAQQCRLRRCA
ncbi:hypothetical protein JQ634_07470 [Bradyrhizobium sp. AUGA SZCCT0240]|jgi:hypothetical protein|uniref:hypothetical protein n=1 Tax=unclassified Bradyrhizobium TaxID=2631580 RepID=UPI001BA4541B|nr:MULTISPECIES: hypothetical protein [unclassified Bradyrhizobium]MBR1194162.1 hypothetical protein [Bradyrhizobium sp. AUGA SZCCT0160]MBR1199182.1 hypothetical protein [Bradyrhizobium sp. AUGA SZCCT0158]MBR1244885.1 hypothetical protein [Bradyrhizobium sp. AUGA SZCCT0274]MBR1249358.1 hypothetical protein [Bradyrhizobium sp. AUGA SZCCT0169]MBR1253536.1 hypothetical protein [Bradyrhizobium sp. AUGA SZCCT0240]